MKKRHLANVPGPFYVEAGCCTFCGVPMSTAPALFAEDEESCFVKKQPETLYETDRMLLAMISSEVRCIRYSGTDQTVIRRLVAQDEGTLADNPLVGSAEKVFRDHVGVRFSVPRATPRAVADSLVANLRRQPMPERYKIEIVTETADRCDLRIAWFEDRFHPISFARTAVPEFDWVIVGLPFFVADWLEKEGHDCHAVYFEADDWSNGRKRGTPLPW